MLFYSILCYAMLCYAMLCYAMLFYNREAISMQRLDELTFAWYKLLYVYLCKYYIYYLST